MIRPLVSEDIPQLTDLHMRTSEAGGHSDAQVRRAYQAQFPELFLNYPGYDPALPSLVNEEKDGTLSGLLAVMARPMKFKGQPITMAVSSRMSVDPASRSKLAGVQLMKTFLNGPQDVAIADFANQTSKKLWERLGGTTARLYAFNWTKILRPCKRAVNRLELKPKIGPFARVGRVPAKMIDAGIQKVRRFKPCSELTEEPLTEELFHKFLPQFSEKDDVYPIYEWEWVHWLWNRMDYMWDEGRLFKVVVKDKRGQIAGWFIYNIEPTGYSHVAQICANESTIVSVLQQLFHHAQRHGAVSLNGRVPPKFLREFSREGKCSVHCHAQVTLVHSKNTEILRAFERGAAFLTDFEGEGCLYLGIREPEAKPTKQEFQQHVSADTTRPGEPDIDYVQRLVAEATD